MTKTLGSILLFMLCTTLAHAQPGPAAKPVYVAPVYQPLPLGAIRPEGWLRNQLSIMRKGTSGHLDEVYGIVKNDNCWLGGAGD